MIPPSTIYFSVIGQSSKNFRCCSLVQKPITCSTPARLYQLLSKITISPAAGKYCMYRWIYIWVFSRSEGAGSDTKRNTRGLTRSVMARIVPALAGSITAFEDDNHSKPFVFDPRLKLAKLHLEPIHFFLVLFAFSLPVIVFLFFFIERQPRYFRSSRTARPRTFTDSVARENLAPPISQEWARVMTSFSFSVGSP